MVCDNFMWKRLICREHCCSPVVRFGYGMISYPLGIRLSHIHTDETKQIFKPEFKQNVSEGSVNSQRNDKLSALGCVH